MIRLMTLVYFLSLSVQSFASNVSKSEVEKCMALLTQAHSQGLTEKLQAVVWDGEMIESTIAGMKSRSEITSPDQEQRIRAQLTLGALFHSAGLIHEAVYLVFKDRYKSDREIRDAIQGFKRISEAEEKAILLAEVIERVLQYIPDVDAQTVNQFRELAQYLNMNETQLEGIRSKWMVYDQGDNFVEILQGGIMSILLSADESFIKNVLDRGGLTFKYRRMRWGIEIPARPLLREDVTARKVEVEGQEAMDTDELFNYLKKSSAAARRFFIADQLEFISYKQLKLILQQHRELWLKASLVSTIEKEKLRREGLASRFEVVRTLELDQHEIETTISRLENREPYDLAQFQKRVNSLRSIDDVERVRTEALNIVSEYKIKCDSLQFVNVVSSVVSASTSRLRESDGASLRLIEVVVETANEIGLIGEHANKVSRILTELGNKLGSRAIVKANVAIEKINVITPKFAMLTLEQLRVALVQTIQNLQTAQSDLEAFYRL